MPLDGFVQLFDGADAGGSSTYTYMLFDKPSNECIIIDPVLEGVDTYIER